MKIYELIAKAHKLKQEASDAVYVANPHHICIQDHYDVPKVSFSILGSKRGDLVSFTINPDGSLVLDDSPDFTGDVDKAMEVVKEVIGGDVK